MAWADAYATSVNATEQDTYLVGSVPGKVFTSRAEAETAMRAAANGLGDYLEAVQTYKYEDGAYLYEEYLFGVLPHPPETISEWRWGEDDHFVLAACKVNGCDTASAQAQLSTYWASNPRGDPGVCGLNWLNMRQLPNFPTTEIMGPLLYEQCGGDGRCSYTEQNWSGGWAYRYDFDYQVVDRRYGSCTLHATYTPSITALRRVTCPPYLRASAGNGLNSASTLCRVNYGARLTKRTPKVAQCDLTLSLSGPSLVEPRDVLESFVATVTDCKGKPAAGVTVAVTSTPEPKSGFHSHNEPARPAGGFLGESGQTCGAGSAPGSADCVTDSNGQVHLGFVAPAPAGIHKITAKCKTKTCKVVTSPLTVHVKVDGLIPINTSSDAYFKYVGDSDRHPINHYLLPKANENIVNLGSEYFDLYGDYLHINDASLPLGGLFDIKEALPWLPPHKEHRCGRAVDVRGNGSVASGAVPLTRDPRFQNMAQKAGIDVHSENAPPHYHLWLLGKSRKEVGDKTCAQLP